MVSGNRDSIAKGSAEKSVRRVELLLFFFEIYNCDYSLLLYICHESDFYEREKAIDV